MPKKKNRSRGVPIDWEAGVRIAQSEAVEAKRAQQERDRVAAELRRVEAAEARAATIKLIEEAPDAPSLIRALEDYAPEEHGHRASDWLDVLGWCKANPVIAFGVRDHIIHGGRYAPSLESVHFAARSTLMELVRMVDYPGDVSVPEVPCIPEIPELGNNEGGKSCCFRVYTIPGRTRDEMFETTIKPWAREMSDKHGGHQMVEDAMGRMGPIRPIPVDLFPEADQVEKLSGIVVKQAYDHGRRRHPTTGFTISAIEGGEKMVTDLLRRVVEHNTRMTRRLPRDGKKVLVVLKKRTDEGVCCAEWVVNSKDYSGLPETALVRPEEDASFTIGSDGCNIKAFNKEHNIGRGGLQVLCLPGSPQLPIIYLVPYDLNPEQYDAVLEMVADVDEQRRPTRSYSPDPYDYSHHDYGMWGTY